MTSLVEAIQSGDLAKVTAIHAEDPAEMDFGDEVN
jgi:hypothetical protein